MVAPIPPHHGELSQEETIAFIFGLTATAAFTIQLRCALHSPALFCWVFERFDLTVTRFLFSVRYLPQAWKNYKRGSVAGFSTSGIILKLIGASFLCVNSIFMKGWCVHSKFRHEIFLNVVRL
jgi:hypothetical protein